MERLAKSMLNHAEFEELAWACSSSFFERFRSIKLQIDHLVVLMTALPIALLSIWHFAWSDSRKACLTMPKFEELARACSSSFFEQFCSIKLQVDCLVFAYDWATNGIAVDLALDMQRLAKSMLNLAEI